MGHIPTHKQVQKVIDTFLAVEDYAGYHCPVNMRETRINSAHPCGTPMCHAGWYAISAKISSNNHIQICYDYRDGMLFMAKDLGFDSPFVLRQFADKYPKLWGNTLGDNMFISDLAFNGLKEHPQLSTIIHHWTNVRLNIKLRDTRIQTVMCVITMLFLITSAITHIQFFFLLSGLMSIAMTIRDYIRNR